jgi:hypothetical protein
MMANPLSSRRFRARAKFAGRQIGAAAVANGNEFRRIDRTSIFGRSRETAAIARVVLGRVSIFWRRPPALRFAFAPASSVVG